MTQNTCISYFTATCNTYINHLKSENIQILNLFRNWIFGIWALTVFGSMVTKLGQIRFVWARIKVFKASNQFGSQSYDICLKNEPRVGTSIRQSLLSMYLGGNLWNKGGSQADTALTFYNLEHWHWIWSIHQKDIPIEQEQNLDHDQKTDD